MNTACLWPMSTFSSAVLSITAAKAALNAIFAAVPHFQDVATSCSPPLPITNLGFATSRKLGETPVLWYDRFCLKQPLLPLCSMRILQVASSSRLYGQVPLNTPLLLPLQDLPKLHAEAPLPLGSGTFGHALACYSPTLGQYVVKSPAAQSSADDMDREARHLSMFRHPNIVQYFGRESAPTAVPGILLERMNMDLDKYMHMRWMPLSFVCLCQVSTCCHLGVTQHSTSGCLGGVLITETILQCVLSAAQPSHQVLLQHMLALGRTYIRVYTFLTLDCCPCRLSHLQTVEMTMSIGRQMAAGVNCLHARGDVHGDLKANNVGVGIFTDPVTVKLLDLGLVKEVGLYDCGRSLP